MVVGCQGHSYVERLRLLGLQTLETRRHRADLILVYKLLHNLVDYDYQKILSLAGTGNLRGHPLNWPNFTHASTPGYTHSRSASSTHGIASQSQSSWPPPPTPSSIASTSLALLENYERIVCGFPLFGSSLAQHCASCFQSGRIFSRWWEKKPANDQGHLDAMLPAVIRAIPLAR